ncbi:MAG: ATP-binding protein [Eubacteriales bacterium]|nr:ATP-binding protein [Eubacteriales bacterium]
MYSKIKTYVPQGMEAVPALVEASILPGLPSFALSGLSSGKSREVESRLRAAILAVGLKWPKGRIICGISPAWLPKAGSLYDLGLALALIEASNQLGSFQLSRDFCVMGELGLDGTIRPVPGLFPSLEAAAQAGELVFLPEENAPEAKLVDGLTYLSLRKLVEVLDYLRGVRAFQAQENTWQDLAPPPIREADLTAFAAYRGQPQARRGLMLALAGLHPLILLGAPGCGKTMLLSLAASLLPALEKEELQLLRKIYSVAQIPEDEVLTLGRRPFVAPHFSVTPTGLSGGGQPLKPGLFSLANSGILFLDELGEYSTSKLELLREPMSSRQIYLVRSQQRLKLPANFLLLAAANPCRCGYALEDDGRCHCSDQAIANYLQSISGALWNRFHLMVLMKSQSFNFGENKQALASKSALLKARETIDQAWAMAKSRLPAQAHLSGFSYQNGVNPYFTANRQYGFSKSVLQQANQLANERQLSMRSYQQLLRTARTLADLELRDSISWEDIAEALYFRPDPQKIM